MLHAGGLRLQVDPRRGGNIQSLVSSGSEPDWIFFDTSRRPRDATGAEPYDDVWCGGFEELFPNDAPGRFDGRDLPDHGELWNSRLDVVEQSATHVVLRRRCRTVPAVFQKTIRLDTDGARLTISYRIDNTSSAPFHFLFKLHPAMAVSSGDRLLLPGGRVIAVDPEFGTAFGGAPGARWPDVASRAGSPLDLSRVLSAGSQAREFVYVADLPEGWCGVERGATGARILFTFPRDVFPYCWLFLTYGGWRGYHTAVLEPCTNMPKDLETARREGQCAVLAGGGRLECDVSVEVRAGG